VVPIFPIVRKKMTAVFSLVTDTQVISDQPRATAWGPRAGGGNVRFLRNKQCNNKRWARNLPGRAEPRITQAITSLPEDSSGGKTILSSQSFEVKRASRDEMKEGEARNLPENNLRRRACRNEGLLRSVGPGSKRTASPLPQCTPRPRLKIIKGLSRTLGTRGAL